MIRDTRDQLYHHLHQQLVKLKQISRLAFPYLNLWISSNLVKSTKIKIIIIFFSEVGGYFEVQFVLSMKWLEGRVIYRNLKNDTSLNRCLPSETERMWVPKMIFNNTRNRPITVIDETSKLFIEKLGKHQHSLISETENIEYFEGKDNPLFLKRFYDQRFLCVYQLSWYPFDVQHCFMALEMESSYAPFTQLTLTNYEYNGDKYLSQYMIRDVIAMTRDINGIQDVHVEIILSRQIFGVILNIIVPTIVLGFISYSTNFYKDEYFETVIAINLTTMLVIVTLFVSVSIASLYYKSCNSNVFLNFR